MRWTPEKVEELRGLAASGTRTTDIAKLFGVSRQAAQMRLRRLRRPDPPRRPPVDDAGLRARSGHIIAAALTFAATAAQAQGFNPYLNSNGAPPFMYGSQPTMAPAQSFDWNFRTPNVPSIVSPVPAPTQGPTNYPCTMPGCR